MSCNLHNKEPMALIDHMELYFKERLPDCSIFSEDKFEIKVHKEVLYQTKYLQEMIKTLNLEPSYEKIEILCPGISKEELEIMVNFLYTGQISSHEETKSYEVCLNLTNLFGFPKEWNLDKVSSISEERIGQPKLNDIVKQAIELTNFSGKKKKELFSSKSNEIQDFEYYDDMGDTSHIDNEELDIKPNIETIEMKVEDSESYLNAEELKSME